MNKRQQKKAVRKYLKKIGPILQAKAHHDILCSTPLFDYLNALDKPGELKRQKETHQVCLDLLKRASELGEQTD